MAVPYYNYVLSIYNEREARKVQRKRMRDRSDPFDLSDGEFQSLWRISKPMALYIIEKLAPDLEPKAKGLPVHLKVLWSIQFLATGGYQKQVGQSLCQPQSTVSNFIGQFLDSMYKRLLVEWIHFPASEAAWRCVSSGFQQKFNIPNILGYIDCTHVKIFVPSGPQEAQYKNRRMDTHTINVQLVVDSNCRILNVNARHPGSVHDAFIWDHSVVKAEMKRLYHEGIGKYILLGDSSYPLEPWLMTPVLHAEPDTPEQRYNDWHCQVRNTFEQTNGYLKGTLKCLGIDQILHYSPDKASRIIYACCIIYNLMKHFGVPMEESASNEQHEDEPNAEEPVHLLKHSQAAARRAQIIARYFEN